jgi:hypothetical protein
VSYQKSQPKSVQTRIIVSLSVGPPLSLLPRPSRAMASTSTLSNLTPAHLKGLKANILTEHFGWGPESFAKQGMDLANVVMYGATEAVEASLMDKCRTDQAAGEVVLDEEEVQKVSLERVVMSPS